MKIALNAIPALIIIGIAISWYAEYDVLNFSINNAPTIANNIPNHIGLIKTSVGITVNKNIPNDIPPNVTWLNASAISESRLQR